MDGDRTIDPLALRRLGEALRWRYYMPKQSSPSRLNRLVEQLKHVTKEDDYLYNAKDAVRLAQHAPSLSEKTRLIKLAEG